LEKHGADYNTIRERFNFPNEPNTKALQNYSNFAPATTDRKEKIIYLKQNHFKIKSKTDVAILPFRRRNPIEAVKPSALDSSVPGGNSRQPANTKRKEQIHGEAFNRFRSII